MARIDKARMVKLEIIQVAVHKFLEKGFSNTSVKAISDELEMSTGNLTFHFPSKEHLLAELVEILCDFQRNMMEEEANEGYSSIMAVCLELTAMAAMCEADPIAKDLYISAYSSPISLEIIRRNDAKRAKSVFGEYCPGWTEQQFAEAETLVSGIEYATLMTTGDSAPLDVRITAALNSILTVYNIPEETRRMKIDRVLAMDYRQIGQRVLQEFKNYVKKTLDQAFYDLLKKA